MQVYDLIPFHIIKGKAITSKLFFSFGNAKALLLFVYKEWQQHFNKC